MTALAGGSRLCEVSSCFQEARTPRHTQKTHTACGKLNDQGITLLFRKVKENEEKCGIVGWQDIKQVFFLSILIIFVSEMGGGPQGGTIWIFTPQFGAVSQEFCSVLQPAV